MRTDTKTFPANVHKALRSKGLTSRKARIATDLLVEQARARNFPVLPDGSAVELVFDSADYQSVRIEAKGAVSLEARPWGVHQPLVSTEPTPEQFVLRDRMEALRPSIYDAIDHARQVWELQNGEAKTDEEREARRAFAQTHPAVLDLNGHYDELRRESLAINPYASAFVVDPDAASFYSDMHKDCHGFRPHGGRITWAAMKAEMSRMQEQLRAELAEAA